MNVGDFVARLRETALPNNPMGRVRTLAKELAEGAVEGMWGADIRTFRGSITDENVQFYLGHRWDGQFPNLLLLVTNGYLQSDTNTIYLTKAAFDLLDEAEPSSIFISYRRSDSSAFALLVLARLKAAGLDAFLDLTLEPGEEWQKGLQNRIQSREYFVLLLGKETLISSVVRQEILWAIEAGTNIIPIWHSGFSYKTGAWDVPPEIDQVLTFTHTIRVLEESALAYNNAIVELLNRFGLTP